MVGNDHQTFRGRGYVFILEKNIIWHIMLTPSQPIFVRRERPLIFSGGLCFFSKKKYLFPNFIEQNLSLNMQILPYSFPKANLRK